MNDQKSVEISKFVRCFDSDCRLRIVGIDSLAKIRYENVNRIESNDFDRSLALSISNLDG